MKELRRFLIILCLAAVAATPVCRRQVEPPAKPAVTVVTIKLARRTVQSSLTLTGTVEPDQAARLGAQVDGEVIYLGAREGDSVRSGQVLVRIDPSRLSAALEEARADWLSVKAELEDARRVLERDRALFERQGIGKERLEKSETSVLRLEAAEARARAKISGLEAQLADTEIRAPFDGYVLERSVEMGDVVRNGMPLLTIATRTSHFLVAVSETVLARLAEGGEVRLKLDADQTAEGCRGRVTRIRPKVDAATRTADVEVTPRSETCSAKLLPGMLVRISFVLEERQNALAVPVDIMSTRPDGSRTLFVVEGDVARQRKVTTGLEGGGWIEITGGVQEGDQIVVQGFEKLRDGAIVSPAGQKQPPESEGAKKKAGGIG
jgi:RND family efflux transporter MFP subunit